MVMSIEKGAVLLMGDEIALAEVIKMLLESRLSNTIEIEVEVKE